ncbi:MAG: hypothetical protein M3R00_06290 [Pseudomonadota bacterium]|nr:hypothetical protein [Pseudomonadota bacterium]
MIYESFAKIFRQYPVALIKDLLPHFTTVDLIAILSTRNFMIIQALTELIACDTKDQESSSFKLLYIGKKILSDHLLLDDAELEGYWKMVSQTVKPSILQSLEMTAFATLFTRANNTLTQDLLSHLGNANWLNLLAHNDFLFCRKLVCAQNVDLTLTKLHLILVNRFRELQKAIALACLKIAVLENKFDFFQRFAKQYAAHLEILLTSNAFELLVTACNSANPDFVNLLLPNIAEVLRHKTLMLVATWLSMELNTVGMEHDHLRRSTLSDVTNLLTESELLTTYQYAGNAENLKEAKNTILKIPSHELPENHKVLLLTMLVIQADLNTTIKDVHHYLSQRSKLKKHLVLDEKEIAIAHILNKYLGYNKFDLTTSQASQQEKYSLLKMRILSRLDLMTSVDLYQEIQRLLSELTPYRATDISKLRRIVMPRPSLSEQKSDVEDHIHIKMNSLSPVTHVVWRESLDIKFWPTTNSPQSDIPGTSVHLALGSALMNKNPSPYVTQPMVVASMSFFILLKKHMKPIVQIPIRIQEKSVIKISSDINLLTNETAAMSCEHPLKSLLIYLLYDRVITSILKKAFDPITVPTPSLVQAITLDCHTNSMPCSSCLHEAASAQKNGTLLDKIETVLKSRRIPYHPGNLSLLIRISIQSITKTMQPQVMEAKPESKFTPPPSSQLSPFTHSSQINSPTKSDPAQYLLANMPKPTLVDDVCYVNNPAELSPKLRHYLKPEVMPDMKTLAKFSILIAKLPITEEDAERKYSPDVNEYTALIGSCNKPKQI